MQNSREKRFPPPEHVLLSPDHFMKVKLRTPSSFSQQASTSCPLVVEKEMPQVAVGGNDGASQFIYTKANLKNQALPQPIIVTATTVDTKVQVTEGELPSNKDAQFQLESSSNNVGSVTVGVLSPIQPLAMSTKNCLQTLDSRQKESKEEKFSHKDSEEFQSPDITMQPGRQQRPHSKTRVSTSRKGSYHPSLQVGKVKEFHWSEGPTKTLKAGHDERLKHDISYTAGFKPPAPHSGMKEDSWEAAGVGLSSLVVKQQRKMGTQLKPCLRMLGRSLQSSLVPGVRPYVESQATLTNPGLKAMPHIAGQPVSTLDQVTPYVRPNPQVALQLPQTSWVGVHGAMLPAISPTSRLAAPPAYWSTHNQPHFDNVIEIPDDYELPIQVTMQSESKQFSRGIRHQAKDTYLPLCYSSSKLSTSVLKVTPTPTVVSPTFAASTRLLPQPGTSTALETEETRFQSESTLHLPKSVFPSSSTALSEDLNDLDDSDSENEITEKTPTQDSTVSSTCKPSLRVLSLQATPKPFDNSSPPVTPLPPTEVGLDLAVSSPTLPQSTVLEVVISPTFAQSPVLPSPPHTVSKPIANPTKAPITLLTLSRPTDLPLTRPGHAPQQVMVRSENKPAQQESCLLQLTSVGRVINDLDASSDSENEDEHVEIKLKQIGQPFPPKPQSPHSSITSSPSYVASPATTQPANRSPGSSPLSSHSSTPTCTAKSLGLTPTSSGTAYTPSPIHQYGSRPLSPQLTMDPAYRLHAYHPRDDLTTQAATREITADPQATELEATALASEVVRRKSLPKVS